ncbi:MAG: hypothetical protein ABJG78_07120 [Cyclobacteriaceae bacterium]
MLNKLRTIFGTIFLLSCFIGSAQSQIMEGHRLKITPVNVLKSRPHVYFNFSRNRPFRYSGLRYYPTKIHNTHVISVAQPNRMFDNVYYVDEKGNSVYRSVAVTAPMNRFPNEKRKFDSFNPTGAETLQEAIMQGITDMIFLKRR